MKEIGKSYGIDDEVVQNQRQRDDNDLQDERQDQPKEEENQASAHDHNGHDYDDLTRSWRVVCECVLSSTYTEAEFKDIASTQI
ncbi:hypothetical protein Tco_0843956 [Tanacetum coccineum]